MEKDDKLYRPEELNEAEALSDLDKALARLALRSFNAVVATNKRTKMFGIVGDPPDILEMRYPAQGNHGETGVRLGEGQNAVLFNGSWQLADEVPDSEGLDALRIFDPRIYKGRGVELDSSMTMTGVHVITKRLAIDGLGLNMPDDVRAYHHAEEERYLTFLLTPKLEFLGFAFPNPPNPEEQISVTLQ